MLFNSYPFIFLFLPLTLSILYLSRRLFPLGAAVWVVAIASLVFYSVWNIHFLPILLSSVVINYLIGSRIMATQSAHFKRGWLVAGITGNLTTIGYFKYTGFILTNISAMTGIALPAVNIVLPIGISFFTFTQIAFLVDAYRGHYPEKYPFMDYLLFVTFFPHLVAGPILIHKYIIPQFESERFGRPSARVLYAGAVLFAIGLFKKIMVADAIAPFVNTFFTSAAVLSTPQAWLAALSYTLQLYFDFSGYSDMALGLAMLMNIRIPNNFNSPYKAASMTEFWRRWHISLSRFLRDYLYIPLGGNRKGPGRQVVNLFITMALAGLWHGAGWTFIVWGGMHGVMLGINHLWRKLGIHMPRFLGWAITFPSVMIGWVVFRAATLHDALTMVGTMSGITSNKTLYSFGNLTSVATCMLALLIWCVVTPPARWYAIRKKPSVAMTLVFALMLVISIINMRNPSEFLYFQF